jgi:small nuclear ribonucleoprotein D3
MHFFPILYLGPFVVSVTGKRGAGIPVILLHDATGGIVTVELKNGCVYKGTLEDTQDNMNCMIKVSSSW